MLKGIKYLILSMLTVAKHLFRKPVTLEYPEKKRGVSDRFRGKLFVEIENCAGCGTCMRVCPTGAISIKKSEEGKVEEFSFNLEKCIFCGNCKFYCPHNSIKMLKEYELATVDKNDLQLVYKKGGCDERNE